jgi:hypothetical protein
MVRRESRTTSALPPREAGRAGGFAAAELGRPADSNRPRKPLGYQPRYSVPVPGGEMQMGDLSDELANAPRDSCNRRMGRAILLIEDDDMARKTIARMLQRIGYEVIAADSGEDGGPSASQSASPEAQRVRGRRARHDPDRQGPGVPPGSHHREGHGR